MPDESSLANEYDAAGVTVHVVPMERVTTSGSAARWARYAVRWPVTVLRLARLAHRLDACVVHSNSLHCWYGWAAALLVRRPHVWHAREIVFQSGPALRLERLLTRHFAETVVAVSASVAAQLDPRNVEVVTDEPDPNVFRPDRAGIFRQAVGIHDDTPLVGSVARIDTWKGFEVLLTAFPAMRRDCAALELVVAGSAVEGKEPYELALRSRAAAMPGVHWLGLRRDVADLMADLDVFVQVSTQPEPFGLVVVEALASGVPVVAGAEGGPLEILGGDAIDGPVAAGRLVAPGDPGALAEAVVQLVPARTNADLRRARRPLRDPDGSQFAALFDRLCPRQP